MKSKEEIERKLENSDRERKRLINESGEYPCKPDGSKDTKHIEAVVLMGTVSALRWVLDKDD